MIEIMLLIGIALLLLAVFFITPVLGFGMVLPGVGDVIDIPVAAVCALAGLALIIMSLGWWFVEYLIGEYWWVLLIAGIIIALLFTGKVTWGLKRRK